MNGTDRLIRRLAPAAPIVLVNVVAFSGQLAFLREHLPWVPAGQVLMAVTLEVIAVYLAWQAHLAQLANDSALRLRLAAYGFALLIAAMNYSHYAGPGWSPTFVAVAVALCSTASPWLWGVHTRRTSRDQLMARGLVEPHAVRLGGTRWVWHPYRSARVMWSATWAGTTDPVAAIGALYPSRASVAASVPASVPPKLPTQREIQDGRYSGVGCSQPTAPKIRSALRARDREWAQAVERGRGDSLTSGPGSAPAAERSRGGAPVGGPPAAPAAAPAGVIPNPPLGAPAGVPSANGREQHG